MIAAAKGPEALDLRHRRAVDFRLSDCKGPDLTGLEFLAAPSHADQNQSLAARLLHNKLKKYRLQ